MSVIYFAETANRKDFVAKIAKIFKAQLDQANSIFIKPNIVSSEPYPTTTHPEILDALLDHLSGRKLVVGDGHAVDTGYTKNILGNSPLKEICSRHGVEFVNLYRKKMKKWTSPRGHKGIAEVNVACPTNLFIVDAVETLTKAQECRHGGCPAKLGTIIAGTDPVSLDAFGQKLLQKVDINLEENIKHLNYAQEYDVGKKDYRIIKI